MRTVVGITGSEGMIGKELLELLSKKDVIIKKADLKLGHDLRDYNECLKLCEGVDEVYSLVGIKGNPKMTKEWPVDFMAPMLQFDTNMILAAQKCGVKRFLYTSSIAVENPETDKYPAWAKKTGEMLIEAMRTQYPKGTKYCVVRPANVFGRYDNFNNPDAMVVTALISKAFKSSSLEVWGDGSQERDFINAKDVAAGMIKCMEKMPKEPINLCSGQGTSIKTVAELIVSDSRTKAKEIKWDKSKPTGAKSRVMKPNYKQIGFSPKVIIADGIKDVIGYYAKEKGVKNGNL